MWKEAFPNEILIRSWHPRTSRSRRWCRFRFSYKTSRLYDDSRSARDKRRHRYRFQNCNKRICRTFLSIEMSFEDICQELDRLNGLFVNDSVPQSLYRTAKAWNDSKSFVEGKQRQLRQEIQSGVLTDFEESL